MTKELPYFKFFPGKWITGDITIMDDDVQGVFINVCAYYWMKQCSISLANAKQRFSKCLDSFHLLLESKIIKVDDDENIVIEFLDEQYKEFSEINRKRSKNGHLGGVANAKQKLSKREANANILREDKIREDKIKNVFFENEKLNKSFMDFLNMRKKIKKPCTEKAIKMAINRLQSLAGSNEDLKIKILDQSTFKCWQDLYELKNTTETTQNLVVAR